MFSSLCNPVLGSRVGEIGDSEDELITDPT